MNAEMEQVVFRNGLESDHFIGLWIYRPYGKTRRWCVTFQDLNHEYWETDLFDTPEGAMRQMQFVIGEQARGRSVEATGQKQEVDR